jgi:hypothetical protein
MVKDWDKGVWLVLTSDGHTVVSTNQLRLVLAAPPKTQTDWRPDSFTDDGFHHAAVLLVNQIILDVRGRSTTTRIEGGTAVQSRNGTGTLVPALPSHLT